MEGHGAGAGALPAVPGPQVAPYRVPDLRHLQPPSGNHALLRHGANPSGPDRPRRAQAVRAMQCPRGPGEEDTMKAAADHQPGAGQPDPTELLRVLDAGLSPGLLERALTHRSYAYENGNLPTNERLEFLGDSVLGLVVTDALFRGYPELPEGQLAKLRAAVVNMRALAGVARGLRLGDYLRLGRGEDGTGGRDKSSILADTLEAVIGAVYIERGLDEASALVHRLFDPVIARSAGLGAGLDWKTSLQELTASGVLGVPEYHVEESGPDHQKSFRALVRVGGHVYGTGEGRSKKEAEQQAAEAAWNAIRDGEHPLGANHHGDAAGDSGTGGGTGGNPAASGPAA